MTNFTSSMDLTSVPDQWQILYSRVIFWGTCRKLVQRTQQANMVLFPIEAIRIYHVHLIHIQKVVLIFDPTFPSIHDIIKLRQQVINSLWNNRKHHLFSPTQPVFFQSYYEKHISMQCPQPIVCIPTRRHLTFFVLLLVGANGELQ